MYGERGHDKTRVILSSRNPDRTVLREQNDMDLLIIGFLIAIFDVCAAEVCGPAEYKNNGGECCPMCGKGYVVRRDCTEMSSTTCIPCVGDTYMSEPNGLSKCFKCKSCDMNQGLYIQQKCTTFTDAVCAVLSGYYCESYTEDNECTFGVKHAVCSPGQGVKSPGTYNKDTVCEDCKDGYFSIYGINCTEHTNCVFHGKELEEKGSPTKDNKCRNTPRRRVLLIVPIVFLVFAILFLLRKQLYNIWKVAQTRNTAESTTVEQQQVLSLPTMIPVQESGECPDPPRDLPVEDEDRSMEGLSPQRRMPSSLS
ncbi:tumor necrosis factor receptor superfamily member 14-like isoform X4 [Alosa sapidissima]|uniref:tumor necrosis factor receptor superfamily member 14-like isoform X4 n=1 Tax=Alosa sapidissima TaxID=34773 RepID=UPI001C089007|nr:tumor necrosis factor receptor superfamily member 14-like isoform X4 [Alosa sapidissima]